MAGTTAVLAALALTASACAGQDSASAGGNSSEIHIGAWLPLTGSTATYGVAEKAGADAYFKVLNAQGGVNGRKIEWTVKDNAADPQQTVQIARQLVGQDQVVAIVNANGTSQAEAAFPFVLNQSKVPVLNEVGGAENWYKPPRAGLFGTQTLYEDQAAAVAAWAVQDGAKKILVVHSDPAAFVNVAEQVAPVAKKVDPSVEVDRLPVKYQTTDYTPVISKVKSAKPQAVILILTSPEAAAFLKEAKLQGLSLPTYAYAPVAAESTIALAKDAADGQVRARPDRGFPRPVGLEQRQGLRRDREDGQGPRHGPVPHRGVPEGDQGGPGGVAGHELQRGQSPRYAQRAESSGEERRLDIRRRLLHTPGTRLIARLDRVVRPDPTGHAPGRKAGPYVDQVTATPG
ncbi:ABC transporter substrate-binding protein [Streptomyces sp. NPDC002763]|uniref:ABC transporter substrate-binding protein n=1 Tax=Streptomyces sp. NPDC002763 TaxID=3154427 RepID=UPI00332FD030